VIIRTDCKPEHEVYFVGAKILEELASLDSGQIDHLELYGLLKAKSKVSFDLFRLALDWLFLLGAVEHSHGMLNKCS